MNSNDQQRLREQDDALYEHYGRPLEATHWGSYIVISPQGDTVIASTLSAAAEKAATTLGRDNFAFKIGERAVAIWK